MLLTRRLKFLIFNLLGLQFTWAACAYGATHNWPLLGVYVGIGYIFLHFIFVEEHLRDLKIILVVGIVGITLDILNTHFNVVSFASSDLSTFIIPYWLIILWLVFALMIPHSLYWLKSNMAVATIAGAVGGSLSYLLGHNLGAITLAEPTIVSYIVYFVEWGVLFPLSLLFVQYLSHINVTNNRSYS